MSTNFQYVKNGWAHYKKHEATLVKSYNVVFFTLDTVDMYASLLHHGWLSQEGQSEAYNEAHRNSPNMMQKLICPFHSMMNTMMDNALTQCMRCIARMSPRLSSASG